MAYKIVNKDRQLAIIQLNSRRALYLAPGEESGPVEGLEIDGNKQIEKLSASGLVGVEPIEDSPPSEPEAKPRKRSRA